MDKLDAPQYIWAMLKRPVGVARAGFHPSAAKMLEATSAYPPSSSRAEFPRFLVWPTARGNETRNDIVAGEDERG